MRFEKKIRLSLGREETRRLVYRYMQANGYYPVNDKRTHYTTNSRGEWFKDPRRWEQDVYVSYSTSGNEGVLVEIILKLKGSSFWKQNPPLFSSSDERYFRGFLEHLVASLKDNKAEFYHSEEVKSSRSGLKQLLYYTFLIFVFLSIIFLFTADFFPEKWPGTYVWLGLLLLIFGWVMYRYIEFSRKTIRL